MQETWLWSLHWKEPLEEGMAAHSRILAWGIPMDRGAWLATVHGVTKSGNNWATVHSTAQGHKESQRTPSPGNPKVSYKSKHFIAAASTSKESHLHRERTERPR